MSKTDTINILMLDGYTKKEAQQVIDMDCVMIWNNKDEYLFGCEDKDIEEMSAYFDTLPAVIYNGKKYYVEYTG